MEYRVETTAEAELTEQKSRFIARLVPCASIPDFKRTLEATRREFPDANHVAYAYRIREGAQLSSRFSDDGEVAGTAGRPILAHIEGRALINTALLVIRYFGGIKLGSGGLARAYGAAAKAVLSIADIRESRPTEEWSIVLSYTVKAQFEYVARQHEIEILSSEFAEHVTVRARVFVDRRDAARLAISQLVRSIDVTNQ